MKKKRHTVEQIIRILREAFALTPLVAQVFEERIHEIPSPHSFHDRIRRMRNREILRGNGNSRFSP